MATSPLTYVMTCFTSIHADICYDYLHFCSWRLHVSLCVGFTRRGEKKVDIFHAVIAMSTGFCFTGNGVPQGSVFMLILFEPAVVVQNNVLNLIPVTV